ncbi:delta-aminolevulinic acid dehydratase [candidate division WOR-1 bacterium RIFCSPHIGHO2_01_FULL_53_15]|uniref:Delta-aminolevulinic acid dehydratase n=1 Tax=candidate division WOR-1 bacterium RIFCSPHIGHO2_01_FULL_53_15 TaxID=1802564 RepID=A0A1F4Q4U9_UNCSA|nr:MAG: delta-aminolevulinic acid dehydratase [candidate division WOR-1 bacterium RIFCSPHIGHO2_01_FULL_53_15]OGC10316.1 MAG: delta-aminolevulinic acid dehydratase [candidate division WOR-1 bacterium RIFCSPHIGHO2_02_FULL_53_26]
MNKLKPADLVMPYFVISGKARREPIFTMPGICRLSIDNLVREVSGLKEKGIDKILLFGLPERKDPYASEAYAESGIVSQAVRAIKAKVRRLTVITDVCLCAYTEHGHCRILKSGVRSSAVPAGRQEFGVDKKGTLEALARIALSHARAGADIVAPSAVMDGQVGAIRKILDKNGFKKVKILAYSAKFASAFYGPFREALDSEPQFGDRRGYQLDPFDVKKALARVGREIREGADMVMVKPALAYLDVIYQVKQKYKFPLAAYNVSGEFAMMRDKKLILESLNAMRRAGADIIITYHAKEIAKAL